MSWRPKQRRSSSGGGGPTPPAWLPTGALAYADFVNGHYYAGGATTTVAGTISNPTKVVGGVGLVFENGDNSQTVLGDFAATLLGTSCTLVVEFDFTVGSTLNPIIVANNSDDSEESLYVYVLSSGGVFAAAGHYGGGGFPEVSSTTDLATGVHRVAATFSPTKVSISADGETPAVTDTTAVTATPTQVLFGGFAPDTPVTLSTPFTIRSATVYAPKPDADLPALSAL